MAAIKHLLVSFDVPGAKGGDRRYKRVDEYLTANAIVFHKVFKQVRLVSTRKLPTQISRHLTLIIGPLGSVLVVHVSRPYRFVLGNQNPNAPHRKTIESWFRSA